mgnify:CR=1 FL=1
MRRSRFKSIFMKTMAGVSVLCFVGISALWVRSYWVQDSLVQNHDMGMSRGVFSRRGSVWIYVGQASHRRHGFYHYANEIGDSAYTSSLPMFYAVSNEFGRYLGFPHWLPTILFATTSILLIRKSRRRRYGVGRCTNCGYDLRASPQRCPECGMAVVGESKVST